MRLLLTMAWRNLGRRPMRTFLTMSAMAGATAVLITALCMLFGMIWDLFSAATENYHGHAVVAASRYLDERHIQLALDESRPPLGILGSPEVEGRAARLRGFGLLSAGGAREGAGRGWSPLARCRNACGAREGAGLGTESQSQPAEFLGVDPAAERLVSRLPGRVAEGRFLAGSGKREMVLGAGLARRLAAGLGSDIAVMGQAADGSIAAERFTVVGILDGGDKLRDSTLALVGLRDLQEMLVLEGKVHEWVVRLKEPLKAKAWAERVSDPRSGVEVAPWNRFLPQMSEMFNMIRLLRGIYAAIFYFAVVLVATNTMYMALLERIREFAVMGALGLRASRLASLVLMEALLLSSGSALAGGCLGSLAVLRLQEHPLDFRRTITSITWAGATLQPVYRTVFAWEHVLFPVAVTAVIGVAVALLPAWKLGRTRPVDILREV
ncbi:MAG: ABC transporter permease [Elusimicrobia bacterium]|nr:ABC transporter permease [Elusimicrobiota bacterium]